MKWVAIQKYTRENVDNQQHLRASGLPDASYLCLRGERTLGILTLSTQPCDR